MIDGGLEYSERQAVIWLARYHPDAILSEAASLDHRTSTLLYTLPAPGGATAMGVVFSRLILTEWSQTDWSKAVAVARALFTKTKESER